MQGAWYSLNTLPNMVHGQDCCIITLLILLLSLPQKNWEGFPYLPLWDRLSSSIYLSLLPRTLVGCPTNKNKLQRRILDIKSSQKSIQRKVYYQFYFLIKITVLIWLKLCLQSKKECNHTVTKSIHDIASTNQIWIRYWNTLSRSLKVWSTLYVTRLLFTLPHTVREFHRIPHAATYQ